MEFIPNPNENLKEHPGKKKTLFNLLFLFEIVLFI